MVGKNKSQQQKETSQSAQMKIANVVVTLPRITRILIAGVFALASTLAVSPIIDDIYLDNFFTEETRWLPAMITAAIGLFMYLAGWRIIVGTVGEIVQPTRTVVWYLIVGLVAIFMVALWMFQLLTMGSSSLLS